jgi:hypothetical protein
MAQCFPSLEEIKSFRVPLEPGEDYLVNFLVSQLSNNYEVYVQPYLNGDRPDIVIVHPRAGVLVIEVKDWDLSHYQNPKGGISAWRLVNNDASIRSPLAQVKAYKDNLYELHIDLLFELKITDQRYFSVVETAIYFHNAKTQDAQSFCHGSGFTHILGRDTLNTEDFGKLLVKARLNRPSRLFDQTLYERFIRFLRPPEHTPDMGIEIQYKGKQRDLVISEANKLQKVKGVAGCGKTKVLSGRAVAAYSRTKEVVLILTFNITLRNYIHDQVSKVRAPFPWSGFEITNYHQFFKTQANNYGLEFGGDLLTASDNKDFFASVRGSLHRYKTILIDEVQDYKTEWLRLLMEYFLAEDGEFVVFGDEKQNVYGREMGADRFPIIPRISGQWNQLNKSFRMQSTTLRIAQAFQSKYFQGRYEIDRDVEPIQNSILDSPAKIAYYKRVGHDRQELFQLVRDEILALGLHPNDLVVLAPTYATIRALEHQFRHIAHERTTHAGETEEEYALLLQKYNLEDTPFPENNQQFERDLKSIRRGRKLHFWANAGIVKFSTIYSFKGWEAHTLVLIIENVEEVKRQGSLHELIYTALTRARKNLIIIDYTDLYQDFFLPLASSYSPIQFSPSDDFVF